MVADLAEYILLSPGILPWAQDKVNTSVDLSPSMAFATQIFNFLINCPTSPLGLYLSYCNNHLFFMVFF